MEAKKILRKSTLNLIVAKPPSLTGDEEIKISKNLTVKDPLYDSMIDFGKICTEIAKNPLHTRTGYLKQLSFTDLYYPSGGHSRRAHMFGVMHLASSYTKQLEINSGLSFDPIIKESINIAALTHDVGHGPFSHFWEGFCERRGVHFHHEDYSEKVLEEILKKSETFSKNEENFDLGFIKSLISGEKISSSLPSWIYQIVSDKKNGLDVDRMDYILRDSYYCLGRIKLVDYPRIFHVAKIIDDEICFKRGDHDNLKQIFISRGQLFQQIYHNPKIIANDLMFRDCLDYLDPYIKISEIMKSEIDLITFQKLTDCYVISRINEFSPSLEMKDAIKGKEIWNRIQSLDPYHCCCDMSIKTENFESNWKTKQEFENQFFQETQLPQEDYRVVVLRKDFCPKGQRPFQNVKYYSGKEISQFDNVYDDWDISEYSKYRVQIFCTHKKPNLEKITLFLSKLKL